MRTAVAASGRLPLVGLKSRWASAIRVISIIAVGPLAVLAVAPTNVFAQCGPATGSNITVTCSGATLNQGPGINTGYGDSTQNGLTLTVQPGASVTGTSTGIDVNNANTITNLGTITTAGSGGIGDVYGINANGPLTVINSGTIGRIDIPDNVYDLAGINIAGPGLVITNNSGGLIQGSVAIQANGSASIVNSGQISGVIGGGGQAISDTSVGSVIVITNNASGVITADGFGVNADTAIVTNYGTISAPEFGSSGTAINATTAVTVTNYASGLITSDGTPISAPTVVVVNFGTISGTGLGADGINAGSLQVTNSGSITSGAGGLGITMNSGVIINNAGGIISGDFEGIAAFSGNTIFNAGTITGAGGTAIAFSGSGNTLTLGPGFVINGNVLGSGSDVFQLGGTGTGTFNLALLGTQFTGFTTFNTVGGVWDLTGSDSGFTGTTTVSGGDLVVGTAANPNVTLAGPITVAGGVLSGHGVILGSVTNIGGTVMPGGSIGTLTINGNYTQGPGGALLVQLTPAAASLLAVTGSASLNGTLEAAPSAGAYIFNTHYPVLTAGGGVTGTFATFIDTAPSVVRFTVDYLPDEVDLVVSSADFIGQTRNQNAVGNALTAAFSGATGDFATALGIAATLPPSQIPQALTSLGGPIYGNLAEISMADRRLFLGAMDERMRLLGNGAPGAAVLGGLVPGGWGSGANAAQLAALGTALSDQQTAQASGPGAPGAPGLPASVWARGYGQFGNLASNGGALGAGYSTGGGAMGADLLKTEDSLFGVAFSGGQSNVTLSSNPESGTISFVELGAYGSRAIGYGAAVDGAVIYAHDFYDVSRSIAFTGLSRNATSSYGGDDAVIDLGVSRPITFQDVQVTPRAGFSYYHIGQSAFTESGAQSLDLSVNPNALDALRSRLGVSLSEPMLLGGLQILPELRAAWTHDFLDDRGAFAAAFTGAPGIGFNQVGAATGRDAAELGLGVSFAIAQTSVPGQLSAFIQYDATIAAHQTDNTVAAGLKLTW